MRKYLLLATTAMLFAGNAMAASVATDGQSAILNVKVNVESPCQITEASDFNYGSVWLRPDVQEAKLSMASNGGITKTGGNEYIAKFDETGTPGSFKVQCAEGLTATWNAGCVEGYGCSGNCCLSAGSSNEGHLEISTSSGVTSVGADETIYLASSLTLHEDAIGENFDAPVVMVTLSY